MAGATLAYGSLVDVRTEIIAAEWFTGSSLVGPHSEPDHTGIPVLVVTLETGSVVVTGTGEPVSHDAGDAWPAGGASHVAAVVKPPYDFPVPATDEYLINGTVATSGSGGEPVNVETGHAWPDWNAPQVADRLARYYIQPDGEI